MTKPLHVRELRYLHAAMHYKGTANNACVQWSMGLALDMKRAVVTFGTLRAATPDEVASIPGASLVPFIHCWVEVGEIVYAPTTLERSGGVLVPFDRADYYDRNGVSDVRHVLREAFDDIAHRYRLTSALKHLSPRFGSSAVAGELLRAAGVQYVLDEHRALLPIDSPERRMA
jgi:hypothetical protein